MEYLVTKETPKSESGMKYPIHELNIGDTIKVPCDDDTSIHALRNRLIVSANRYKKKWRLDSLEFRAFTDNGFAYLKRVL